MRPKTLVLGLGNPLVSDEGFGVQAVNRLQERHELPDDVEVVDGGTLGLKLLPIMEDADRIIILDAVDVAQPPGTLIRIGWDDVRRALPVKISPHQETVTEVLGLLELRRGRPEGFEIVGVQPRSLEMGLELSPEVEEGLEAALRAVLEILAGWGHGLSAAGAAEVETGESKIEQ
jgi:hydrogenase maturation protease